MTPPSNKPSKKKSEVSESENEATGQTSRRDFLALTATAMAAVGAGAAALPFIKSLNPAADTLALATLDVDIKGFQVGQTKTVMWRGKPVFIRRRTLEEIEAVKETSLRSLPDPQTDDERFGKSLEWLIVVGVCTHLGCVPGERKNMKPGEAGGWLCACHGSYYDASGRIISGPAPKNLEVPPYQLLNDNTVLRIG